MLASRLALRGERSKTSSALQQSQRERHSLMLRLALVSERTPDKCILNDNGYISEVKNIY